MANSMCASRWITSLLFVGVCLPLHSSAQSQKPGSKVSVRELSIPTKALRAFEQGIDRLAKSDPAGSLPQFQHAISEFAGYYEAYDRLAAAYLKLWRIPEAEDAFRKSIELSGGRLAHPLLALGAILDGQRKFAEAESVIRQGLDLDPDSWTGHYYLGMALFGLNRLQDAEQSAHEALFRNTDFPNAHLLLADIHLRLQDYRAVFVDLDKYLKLVPQGESSEWAKAVRESAHRRIVASESLTEQPEPKS
jgi:tetratricopeptide (TPR) repeat protein